MSIRLIMIDVDYLRTVRGAADVEDRPAGGLLGLGMMMMLMIMMKNDDD